MKSLTYDELKILFDKHSFNIKQGWNNGFNNGFLQCWEEYLIVDITKKGEN